MIESITSQVQLENKVKEYLIKNNFQILGIGKDYTDLIIAKELWKNKFITICIELKLFKDRNWVKKVFQQAFGQLLFCRHYLKHCYDYWLILDRKPFLTNNGFMVKKWLDIFKIYGIRLFYWNNGKNELIPLIINDFRILKRKIPT